MSQAIHATCVVIDEAGVLIRGVSGTGKSTLGRELVATALLQGRFARLVSDDRTRLAARSGRLIAEAVAATAGQIEARGFGLLSVPHETRAVVRLLVELSTEEPSRFPEVEDEAAKLCGVMVPCIRGRCGAPLALLALWRLREIRNRPPAGS